VLLAIALLVLAGVVLAAVLARNHQERMSDGLREQLSSQTLRYRCPVRASASVSRGSHFVPMKTPRSGELSIWGDLIEVNLHAPLLGRLFDEDLIFPIRTSAAARGSTDTIALIGTTPVGRSNITLVGELPERTIRLYLDSKDNSTELWDALSDAGVRTS